MCLFWKLLLKLRKISFNLFDIWVDIRDKERKNFFVHSFGWVCVYILARKFFLFFFFFFFWQKTVCKIKRNPFECGFVFVEKVLGKCVCSLFHIALDTLFCYSFPNAYLSAVRKMYLLLCLFHSFIWSVYRVWEYS